MIESILLPPGFELSHRQRRTQVRYRRIRKWSDNYFRRAMGVGFGGYEKKRAPWVPALIEPPEPSATLKEWQSYRAGLDALEAGCVSVIPIWAGWMEYGPSRLRPTPWSRAR